MSIFQAPIDFLASWLAWLGRVISWIGNTFVKFQLYLCFALATMLVTLTKIVIFIGELVIYLGGRVVEVVNLHNEATSGIAPGGVPQASLWGIANTLLPLTEATAYVTLWFALMVVCAIVRIVKSFIPTVAS